MKREKLLQIFAEEAEEILEHFDRQMLSLEDDPSNLSIVDELFRGAHTLKGSAGAFGYARLEALVHRIEDTLGAVQHGQKRVDEPLIELLNRAVGVIAATLQYEQDGLEGLPEGYERFMAELLEEPSSDEKSESPDETALPVLNEAESAEPRTAYKITLTPESDLYRRGLDPLIFIRALSERGSVERVLWDTSELPDISLFEPTQCYMGPIVIEFSGAAEKPELESLFEFLEPGEYSIDVSGDFGEERVPAASPDETAQAPQQKTVTDVREQSFGSRQEQLESRIQQRQMKVDVQKLDEMFESIGELVIIKNFLMESPELKELDSNTVHVMLQRLANNVKEVHHHATKLRMIPLKESFEKMKRVVRDASKKSGKRLKFSIYGEETEIDKSMADKIAEPLTHLLRNAIDHGIESSEAERTSKQKPSEGEIVLGAFHKADALIIEVRDDGQGISAKNVLKKAIDNGLVDAHEQLGEKEIYSLLMQPGFSTREEVSELSGRGVGLDVVKNAIHALKGNLEIRSEQGKGTSFIITLPLSLSIVDGMVLRCGEDFFVLPTLCVRESLSYHESECHTIHGKEYVQLQHAMVPIIELAAVFGIEQREEAAVPMLERAGQEIADAG